MNTARIVVLAIAVAACGPVIHLLNGPEQTPLPQGSAVQIDTADALVAKSGLQLDETIADILQSRTRPAADASSSFTVGVRALAMADTNTAQAELARSQGNSVNIMGFGALSPATMQR